jgi:hypothetical protein
MAGPADESFAHAAGTLDQPACTIYCINAQKISVDLRTHFVYYFILKTNRINLLPVFACSFRCLRKCGTDSGCGNEKTTGLQRIWEEDLTGLEPASLDHRGTGTIS